MYEEIVAIDLPVDAPDQANLSRRRLWMGASVVTGLAILFLAAVLTAHPPIVQEIDAGEVKAEQAAYRAALTDPEPAMRRARLKDFKTAYPESARLMAVKAQLAVLNAREADDWAALTNITYDIGALKSEKDAALAAYEARWNSGLLGGRNKETKRMRERVNAEPDDILSHDFMVDSGDFPERIPTEDMLGGSNGLADVYIRRSGDGDAALPYGALIEAPRIRRNITPRYPRRAQRRGEEAQIVLRLFIDDRGRVEMTELVSARAGRYEDEFIEAAEYAALRTRFYPKTINGEPVPSSDVEKRYRFQMED